MVELAREYKTIKKCHYLYLLLGFYNPVPVGQKKIQVNCQIHTAVFCSLLFFFCVHAVSVVNVVKLHHVTYSTSLWFGEGLVT